MQNGSGVYCPSLLSMVGEYGECKSDTSPLFSIFSLLFHEIVFSLIKAAH